MDKSDRFSSSRRRDPSPPRRERRRFSPGAGPPPKREPIAPAPVPVTRPALPDCVLVIYGTAPETREFTDVIGQALADVGMHVDWLVYKPSVPFQALMEDLRADGIKVVCVIPDASGVRPTLDAHRMVGEHLVEKQLILAEALKVIEAWWRTPPSAAPTQARPPLDDRSARAPPRPEPEPYRNSGADRRPPRNDFRDRAPPRDSRMPDPRDSRPMRDARDRDGRMGDARGGRMEGRDRPGADRSRPDPRDTRMAGGSNDYPPAMYQSQPQDPYRQQQPPARTTQLTHQIMNILDDPTPAPAYPPAQPAPAPVRDPRRDPRRAAAQPALDPSSIPDETVQNVLNMLTSSGLLKQ
eukprot:TRINITY_DN12044_c0_g1_i4.p2 TRINITY_DN12044_c0_g1~~TRINITY_DN12044_c0_g1_i4.p2  ORF type:complete len:353 (+),score=38.11 TRINITY_DN12044_c0_g1_i4:234-1292(+)